VSTINPPATSKAVHKIHPTCFDDILSNLP